MISGNVALDQAVFAAGTIKTQINQLTQQISTGYVSADLSGLGSGLQTVLDLNPQLAQLTADQTAIGQANGRLSATQTALTQISSIAQSFNAQVTTEGALTPQEVGNIAASAKSALQQVASLLNTQYVGQYVFAGTNSGVAPVPDADQILTSGYYTQISTAVAGLTSNGAAATISQIASIATSNAPGTTPFSGPPGQIPTLNLADGAPVQIGVLANANTLATSHGTTSGSYVRDLLSSLATLSSLTESQVNDPNFQPLIQNTQAVLTSSVNAIGEEAGALGDIQQDLENRGSYYTNVTTVLTAQVSAVQDVDPATAISELSQTQTQLQASYKVISEISSLSLVQYL